MSSRLLVRHMKNALVVCIMFLVLKGTLWCLTWCNAVWCACEATTVLSDGFISCCVFRSWWLMHICSPLEGIILDTRDFTFWAPKPTGPYVFISRLCSFGAFFFEVRGVKIGPITSCQSSSKFRWKNYCWSEFGEQSGCIVEVTFVVTFNGSFRNIRSGGKLRVL